MGQCEYSQRPIGKSTGSEDCATFLNAERTATAAGALHVGVIELEAGAFECLDIVDGNAFQIHFAHLVDKNFQPIEFVNVVGRIFTVFKSHVVAKPRTPSAHDSHAKRNGRWILLAHNLFYFGCRHWSNLNHFSTFTPCRIRQYL